MKDSVEFRMKAGRPVYLDQNAAAQMLHLSPRTLEGMRVKGNGPPFCKLGEKRIVYGLFDLIDWVEGQKRTCTHE